MPSCLRVLWLANKYSELFFEEKKEIFWETGWKFIWKGLALQGPALISNTVLNIIKLKTQPTVPNTFYHWFIFCLFNQYFIGCSSLSPVLSKYWYFTGEVSFQKNLFFFSMKSEKLSDFKDTVNVLWIILMFFVMIKNKLILLHCECTSLLEKKKILYHVSFVVLEFLQSMACNLSSSPSL